jgi:hypothetical protein
MPPSPPPPSSPHVAAQAQQLGDQAAEAASLRSQLSTWHAVKDAEAASLAGARNRSAAGVLAAGAVPCCAAAFAAQQHVR